MSNGLIRCRAAERCRDGENVHDPETGERLGRLGATTHNGSLCEACVRAVEYAIRSLPRDVRDLERLLPPSISPKLRDPDLPEQPRVKKPPPLPMDSQAWTTLELIVYETTVWAESVADAAGLEWDSDLAERASFEYRVQASCALLEGLLEKFLGLVDVEHRARSRTVEASDGHDLDRTVRSRDDVWTTRDGWQAALLLEELHKDVQRLCGRHPGDRILTPCPACHARAVVREHHNDRVVCRACDHAQSDDEHESFLEAASRVFGISGDDTTEVVERRQNPIQLRDIRNEAAV